MRYMSRRGIRRACWLCPNDVGCCVTVGLHIVNKGDDVGVERAQRAAPRSLADEFSGNDGWILECLVLKTLYRTCVRGDGSRSHLHED